MTTMKHLFAIAFASLLLAGCSSDDPIVPPAPDQGEVQPAPEISSPSEYHEKLRTVPYPRSCNELFINPAPLIVPQGMKSASYLQFELSADPSFPEGATEQSGLVAWNMYNPHHVLETGKWYWRFRNVSSDGTAADWSETYDFEVTGAEPVFVTPAWNEFLGMAPQQKPRFYCFLDGKLPMARRNAAEHPEYRSLLQRAGTAVDRDFASELNTLYRNHDLLYQQVEYLYQAYLITEDKQYTDKLVELLDAMLASPCPSSVLYSDNFITSTVTYAHAAVLDLLGDRLTSAQRRGAEQFVADQCRRFYRTSRGYEENHIFDNHFWQINYRLMFASALTIYDNASYPDVLTLLEYLYELWTARAPASGFNRDGVWHNGTGYFTTNSKTLAYMALMLSYITRTDFTMHPWYRNAGQALSYTMPPSGANVGFGDGQERNPEPNRQMAAFADFLARETGDSFATWYASQRPDLVRDDWELRVYRMCNTDSYPGTVPSEVPMLTWYRDAGEVAMHSSLTDVESDVAVGFRSSQFGSGSHTTSSQNAFNLLYAGKTVFRSSGYYQSFSDAHNLMWYRHSRGHNTILVDGIGQPYTTAAYGRILRAASGKTIAYALGDASNAYCGISDDPMWIDNFAKAGIEQTPENGFGPTPLTRYYRHMVMLQPGIVVIYDELEASRPARWEWLLHSPVQFDIDKDKQTLETVNSEAGTICRVTMLTSQAPEMSQTSKFLVPPATQGPQYPDQWHFTARIDGAQGARYLAIIQLGNISDEMPLIEKEGDTYTVDGWQISAALDPASPASLTIVNPRTGSAIDVGTAPTVTVGDTVYRRSYTSSALLIDRFSDGSNSRELIDQAPQSSRNF